MIAWLAYTTFDNSCGVLPQDIDDLNEIFRGGTGLGNVCWQVRRSDLSSLLMYYDPYFEGSKIFFKLR